MTLAPTTAFAGVELHVVTIASGTSWRRVWLSRCPDPFAFGKGRSRFSDPRRRAEAKRFGILYLGSSLKVCVIKAILRDERDGVACTLPIASKVLADRSVAAIAPNRDLTLLDLRGGGPIRMRSPRDVVRGAEQSLGRAWSVAFHEPPAAIDGILIRRGSMGSTTSHLRSRRARAALRCRCAIDEGQRPGERAPRLQGRHRLIRAAGGDAPGTPAGSEHLPARR